MGVFFGTDGLRGLSITELSTDLVYRCANALANIKNNAKILIATDTRKTNDLFSTSFASGAISAGANVVYIGVCPTAGVSYLTKLLNFDYGVVISASHNPAEYNGIKIFDNLGKKINEKIEQQIEKNMLILKQISFDKVGSFCYEKNLVKKYIDFLINSAKKELDNTQLKGLKIVLDCSNGSAFNIAPKIFKKLGAEIAVIGTSPNGTNINKNCGSLNINVLKNAVKKSGADIGFAYDGDSDRLIAVSPNERVVDGDQIIYIFAKYYKEKNKLNKNIVVGTKHTNMGVEKELNKIGIKLIRTDIGDKYVSEMLDKENLIIGGEQSGHIFVRDKLETGDGILNSLILSAIIKNTNKSIVELSDIKLYYQENLNINVKNKQIILNNCKLKQKIDKIEQSLSKQGRVLVRASGTENVIRVMAESKDKEFSKEIANDIKDCIKNINEEDLCVE